ncbi:nucleotidyl transferase AbiEii/AbiGii toxin family protein [Brevibacterium litoralis]|uniref:nucleotidyl transferase AbiEii/AbiGii toxin family protein n=1 Tax=Brevibacterium litoralis TaxID=3138935 RepID=UPI0032EBDAD7
MQAIDHVLERIAADLEDLGVPWALIGGIAVSFRSEPRFTKDVDLAVAVSDDVEAESIVNRLSVRGYALSGFVEQDYVNRLATVRLVSPQPGGSSAFVDLMFGNSGIEDEIVAQAERLEVLPGTFLPVASLAHLITLKVLAGRHQDLTDLGYLLRAASDADLDTAREAASLIMKRGYGRGEDVIGDLESLIEQAGR